MSEWQPIDTAPRNVPILVTDGNVVVALKRAKHVLDDEWPDPVGFGGYEWEWGFQWSDLTHWMPLPDPPQETV